MCARNGHEERRPRSYMTSEGKTAANPLIRHQTARHFRILSGAQVLSLVRAIFVNPGR